MRVYGWGNGSLAPQKGHLPTDCYLRTCAAHDEKSRNDAPKREEGKGESSQGKS